MRSHLSLVVGGISLALCLLTGTAVAKNHQEQRSIEQEIHKIQAKANKLDANGNGWLEEDETSKGKNSLGPLYAVIRKRVDANGDGRVSVAEYVQAQIQALKQADQNQDGWIDEAEAQAQKRKLVMELLTGR